MTSPAGRGNRRTERGDHEIPLEVTLQGPGLDSTNRGRIEASGAAGRTRILGIYLNPGEVWTAALTR